MDKDRSIIAQSAGKDAAELVKVVYSGSGGSVEDVFSDYENLKTRIFNSTLALAGAESVVERFEGATQAAPAPAQQARPSGGSGYGSLGSLEVKSGKHAGKTLDDIAATDPSWLTWARDNLNNPFLKGKVTEYLNAA